MAESRTTADGVLIAAATIYASAELGFTAKESVEKACELAGLVDDEFEKLEEESV